MIEVALIMAGLNIAQNLNSRRQGKKILKSAESIQKEYDKLSNQKLLFEKSYNEQKEIAKKIKNYQDNMAKLQFEKNSNEIKKSLESNIKNVINKYVVDKLNLKEEVLNIKNKILLSNQIQNVENSSIQHDSLATLNKEANDNFKTLLENQINTVGQVTDENLEQQYRLGSNYDDVLSAIRKSYDANIGNAELQYMQDINQLDNFIQAGKSSSEGMKYQGLSMIAEADTKIAKAIMDAAINAYKGSASFESLTGNISTTGSTTNGDFNDIANMWNMSMGQTSTNTGSNDVRGFGNYNPFRSSNPFNISAINKNKFNLLGGNNGIY